MARIIRFRRNKQKGLGNLPNPFFYSSSGASTGQTPWQVPQEMHADASISNFSSPCDIHPTGHSAAQAPQEIHLSVILYAIFFTS
jgi:hypothetical protein